MLMFDVMTEGDSKESSLLLLLEMDILLSVSSSSNSCLSKCIVMCTCVCSCRRSSAVFHIREDMGAVVDVIVMAQMSGQQCQTYQIYISNIDN